jgi:hypothetical protein
MHAFSAVYFKNGPPFRVDDLPVGHLIQAHGSHYAPGACAGRFAIPFLS